MWSHQEPISPKLNVGGDKARPIPQISLTVVLMVPIWTLSNPLQCLTSPKRGVDCLCQQWFKKLDCLLFAPISNFPSKDCKIQIYNGFIPLSFMYWSIVCHFCSRQPVYKRERNIKQGIRSSFKWLSDVIPRFTEYSLSPNSLYGSHCYWNV